MKIFSKNENIYWLDNNILAHKFSWFSIIQNFKKKVGLTITL